MPTLNLCYHDDDWARVLAYECRLAEKSILLSAMSMIPPRVNTINSWVDLWHAWRDAVDRGVRVEIWLAAPQSIPAATRGNQGAGRACAEAGISIHFVRGARLLHAKTAVIDGLHVWVGSGNFTMAACCENFESFIRVDSPRFADAIVSRLQRIK